MTEGTEGDTNPQAESTLDKMARGTAEETGAQGDIQGGVQDGDALSLIEGKMNDMAQDMTADTGGHGDIFVHTERRMDEMAKDMFEED